MRKAQIPGLTLGDADPAGLEQGPGICILTVVQVIAMQSRFVSHRR